MSYKSIPLRNNITFVITTDNIRIPHYLGSNKVYSKYNARYLSYLLIPAVSYEV